MRALAVVLKLRTRSASERALLAVNAGLALGFALTELRNLATRDLVVASDFTVFWTGWTLILDGRPGALYAESAQREVQQSLMNGMHFEGGLMAFLNPPHAALLSAPFGWVVDSIGEQAAFAVWTAASLWLVVLLVRALCDQWSMTDRYHRAMLAFAVLAFYPVFCAVRQGQTSVLLALAAVGVYQMAKADRPWAGGAWLLVLTIKPQLVPMVVIYLAARRNWRVLWCAGALLAASVVITAIVLGPAIWFDYLSQVRDLEHFWGTGTPDYMLNVRGGLTRIFGLGPHLQIDAVSELTWLVAMGLVGIVLVRRRVDQAHDPRPAYAFVIAVALLTNPHLFVHDVVLWTVPLVLCAAAIRDRAGEWQRFARFALSWNLLFAASGFLDVKSTLLTLVDLRLWALAAATVIIGLCWRSASALRTFSTTGPAIERGCSQLAVR
jgi:hypothetical protein